MLPNYYQFYCPVKILSGQLAVSNIPYEMTLLHAKKAFIITDKGVVKAGLIDIVKSAFEDSTCEMGCIFDDVPQDSGSSVVNKAAMLFEKEKCDCLIAVGGGSALDTAKGVNILVSENAKNLLKFQGVEKITKDLKPLIAVPTTAGTGSEVTKIAVIYNEDTKEKMAFVSDRLYPKIAVIDSRMTMTMPPKITAATGMDALTHAIEAYICLQNNPIDDIYAKTAIDLIRRYLIRSTENGKDEEARLGMANAALFAGIAFSNSMVGMVHALAHALGGVFHVPHGIANAILLPWCLEYNISKEPKKIAELAAILGGSLEYLEHTDLAHITVSLVRNLLQRLNRISNIPMRLRDAGVTRDKLSVAARLAINDGALIYNPAEVSYDDALTIYEKAF
ncbi:MAG: iron-containing alcohol dehydrogenase [Desulfobacterales bacterium]|nr:iron-containing alcohol dehydrogenase [Desulfobacterales bacterium]